MPYETHTATVAVPPATPPPWRPQPVWLVVGLVAGAVCGALSGTVLLEGDFLASGEFSIPAAVGAASMGTTFGGVIGTAVGLVVGFVMTFLGGSQLGGQAARERAFLVTFVTTLPMLSVVLGLFFPAGAVIAFLASVAGGLVSYWLAPGVAV